MATSISPAVLRDIIKMRERGNLPTKPDGSVDLYRLDRMLRNLSVTSERMALLRRLAKHHAARGRL